MSSNFSSDLIAATVLGPIRYMWIIPDAQIQSCPASPDLRRCVRVKAEALKN